MPAQRRRESSVSEVRDPRNLATFGFREVAREVGSPIAVPDQADPNHRCTVLSSPISVIGFLSRVSPILRAGTPATIA